ncbi:MAG: hypothetical protein SGILL_004391, partial [Bacillariaceae sp.]
YVNGLAKGAIDKTKKAMMNNGSLGLDVPVCVKAVWEEGKVTGVDGKLVCFAPPEIQLGDVTSGPSINSFCPLIAAGCFCLVMMLKAAEEDIQFQEVTSNTQADANLIGFYKHGWTGDHHGKGLVSKHPWTRGINLGIVIRSDKSQEELVQLADHSNKHCPSSEIMKRDFPVEVEFYGKDVAASKETDWDKVGVYYNMDKYHEIAKKDSFDVKQEANMTWHCHNENKLHPNSLMSFSFPHDSDSNLVLGFDAPIGRPNLYANPVQACFFGGLSTLFHTIACRIYAHGYKVAKIEGAIKTNMNKRKVLAADAHGYVFPDGATIEISVTSNAPEHVLQKVEMEAEEMSPTMMNWRDELPFMYGVARLPPRDNSDATSIISEVSTANSRSRFGSDTRKRLLNFFWKKSHDVGQETY